MLCAHLVWMLCHSLLRKMKGIHLIPTVHCWNPSLSWSNSKTFAHQIKIEIIASSGSTHSIAAAAAHLGNQLSSKETHFIRTTFNLTDCQMMHAKHALCYIATSKCRDRSQSVVCHVVIGFLFSEMHFMLSVQWVKCCEGAWQPSHPTGAENAGECKWSASNLFHCQYFYLLLLKLSYNSCITVT